MEPNKKTDRPSTKKKFALSDIIMMLLGVFLLIRIPWSNMNSFYFLLFFLYIFCIMMRITNLRKQQARKEAALRKQAEASAQAETTEATALVEHSTVTPEDLPSEKEEVSSDM